MIRRFRKKPIEIEAVQITKDNIAEVARWIAEVDTWHGAPYFNYTHIGICTLEGVMHAGIGDWVVKEPFPTGDRQFYPVKPSIFEATYESIE